MIGVRPAYTDQERDQLLEVLEQVIDGYDRWASSQERMEQLLDQAKFRAQPIIDRATRRALKAAS